MGVFDQIGDALSGKAAQPQSAASDTKTTKITADDIAEAKRRRRSPDFQAALRARDAAAGNYAFHPPQQQGAFLRNEPADEADQ